jgi:hypothetical protein
METPGKDLGLKKKTQEQPLEPTSFKPFQIGFN